MGKADASEISINKVCCSIAMNCYKKSEKKSAQLVVGGKRQPGSGAFFWAKGDIVHPLFLIEHKETVKETMRVRGGWLEKIDRECRTSTKYPALMFYFSNTAFPYKRWVMFPKDSKRFGDFIADVRQVRGKTLLLTVDYLRNINDIAIRMGVFPLFVIHIPQLAIPTWYCTTLEVFNEVYRVK